MGKIAVIGLGKLGLCMAGVYASKGFDVIGVDVYDKAVDAARKGQPLTPEPGLVELLAANRARLEFTNDFAKIKDAGMSFIIVPTPTNPGAREFSNEYALDAIKSVGGAIGGSDDYHVVVMVSTVMPRSMDTVCAPALEVASGKKIGREIGLCYNPEFVALGDVINGMLSADIQLIGESDMVAGDALAAFHRTITPDVPVCRMSFVEAELSKLLLNVALSSRITYANLVGRIADVFGVDAHKILDSITRDHRIGRAFMRPGSPVSGPCLPRDLSALVSVVDHAGIVTLLPQAMIDENAFLIQHIENELLKNGACSVAILGWSYKPGTPLTDESAAFSIARMLLDAGCAVYGYDPAAEIDVPGVTTCQSAEAAIRAADIVYVHTAWPEFAHVPAALLAGRRVVDYWGILPKENK